MESSVTILVVDDEVLVRHTLEVGLRRNGYRVLQAGDGDEALDVLGSIPVDLVVTDLAMPRREGLETIIEIRRRFLHVRVIALSGVFGGLYLEMARQLGAAAALAKPVAIDVLRQTVDAVLGSRVRDTGGATGRVCGSAKVQYEGAWVRASTALARDHRTVALDRRTGPSHWTVALSHSRPVAPYVPLSLSTPGTFVTIA